jgi:tetratricopeptide (TPR) repeat protein
MNDESTYALFLRGQALLAEGRYHQAAIVLGRARAKDPGKASIRETLARAYYSSGQLASAREEFEAAIEIDPTNDYAHFGLALCLERVGEITAARAHVKLAVAMRPDDDNYQRALARIARAS